MKAGREVGFKVPVVVRLEGNEVEKARADSPEGRDRTADAQDRAGPDRRREAGGRIEQVVSLEGTPRMNTPARLALGLLVDLRTVCRPDRMRRHET